MLDDMVDDMLRHRSVIGLSPVHVMVRHRSMSWSVTGPFAVRHRSIRGPFAVHVIDWEHQLAHF
jgi:hypothetical protein